MKDKVMGRKVLAMKKVLLTSSGFENIRILKVFVDLLENKGMSEVRALFIPTAAVDSEAIAVLPKCMNDLLYAGIPADRITVFDLHCSMTQEELCQYDVIYFTGGDPRYLLQRINDTGFNKVIPGYLDQGGVYVGVSAGSWVATKNLPNGLGLVNCTLDVHMQVGTKNGPVDLSQCPHVQLTSNNMLVLKGDKCSIVE